MKSFGILFIFLFTTLTVYSYQKQEITTIHGNLFLKAGEKNVKADLDFHYIAKEEDVSQVSLYLTKDIQINDLEGAAIKSYEFDKENEQMPFGTLTIQFNKTLETGEGTFFNLSYTGISSKGFFTENYNWIDVDPDFMILPAFTGFQPFNYEIQVRIDEPSYKFIDAENEQMSSSLLAKASSASYFASIAAGSNMDFTRFAEDGYTVNLISNKEDSIVNYLGAKSLEILKYFNNTIGKEKKVKNFSVLYRPMADTIFPTMRNLGHLKLIMFTSDHNRIPTLAHEVSHFWWNRGNDFTMEKWLDESFATYSEVMYLRHSEGQQSFQEEVEKFRKVAEGLPPLLGYDRFGKNWSSILYFKGPYLLYQLEEKLGREIFLQFLNKLNQKEVSTTVGLLEELEKIGGRENKEWFLEKLKS